MRHTPRLGWLILLAAVGVTLALGAFGVGHGGPSQTNLDMRFLYLAGVFWHRGISAYTPVPPYPVDSWLADAVARYDFAYPPQIAPLCLLLAAWSTAGARLLMTALNVGAAVLLAAVCVRRARDPVPDRVSPGRRRIDLVDPGHRHRKLLDRVRHLGRPDHTDRDPGPDARLALRAPGPVAARRVLLAGSTIKPQLGFLVILWLVLERRWRALAATAVTVVALAAVPIGISGPVGVITEWSAAAWRYASGPYNTLGSRMIFGLGNVLYVAGIESSFLLPLALLIVGSLWYYRASLADEDVLALLVGLSLLFGFSHSYDIAALAPLVPAFWRHVHTRTTASLLALALMLVVTLPNSLLESFVSPLLLHVRVVGLFAALSWLVAMSVKGAGVGRRDRARSRA